MLMNGNTLRTVINLIASFTNKSYSFHWM